MARQGHGFLTSLPIRVVQPGPAERGELVDVARDGKELGEIVFYGNICAKGYYKDPEATRKLFAGGALHSGDLAVMHPDGSAQIQDRAKDIIISGEFFIMMICAPRILYSYPYFLALFPGLVTEAYCSVQI
jgi:acyl-CoA synthetase (AMP-forming)/AMP-acid ligase II